MNELMNVNLISASFPFTSKYSHVMKSSILLSFLLVMLGLVVIKEAYIKIVAQSKDDMTQSLIGYDSIQQQQGSIAAGQRRQVNPVAESKPSDAEQDKNGPGQPGQGNEPMLRVTSSPNPSEIEQPSPGQGMGSNIQ